jgi:hypothetical protein
MKELDKIEKEFQAQLKKENLKPSLLEYKILLSAFRGGYQSLVSEHAVSFFCLGRGMACIESSMSNLDAKLKHFKEDK